MSNAILVPVPHLLLISEIAQMLQEKLRQSVFSASKWLVHSCTQMDQALQMEFPQGPDLVVLEVPSQSQGLAAQLDHARALWPHTSYMLFTSNPKQDVMNLKNQFEDITILHAPDLRTLCSSIEQHLKATLPLGGQELSLTEVLKLLAQQKKSVVVRVHAGNRWGRLHLEEGILIDAKVESRPAQGYEAALEMLSWNGISVFLERLPALLAHPVNPELATLLLEDAAPSGTPDHAAIPQEGSQDPMFFKRPTRRAMDPPGPDTPQQPSQPEQETVPSSPAAEAAPVKSEVYNMASIKETLESSLSTIDGATAACLVDYNSGMALGTAGGGVNLELAAGGNTDVVRAKLRTMKSLGIQGQIEDILITLDNQYHIIYLIPNTPLFLYLVLQKDRANLALARYKLKSLGGELKV